MFIRMNEQIPSCLLEKMPTEAIEQAAEILKQLAHPVRLKIIDLLHTMGELPVCEITHHLDISQAATSQHLNQMRRIGMLRGERRGKAVWYSVIDDRPIALLNCICNCCVR